MHIKRYTIVSFLLIAFIGWYISTFISDGTTSINILGIVMPSLSNSIWVMSLLFVFYLISVTHMILYSIVGDKNIITDRKSCTNKLSDIENTQNTTSNQDAKIRSKNIKSDEVELGVDELTKWAKLLEKGFIDQEDFNQKKRELL